MAKYLDENGVLYLWNKIKTLVSNAINNSGFQKNQNAFGKVTVGSTTITADAEVDTLNIVAGNNVTLTTDATNDKITISAKDTVYTHPTHIAKASGLYKVTVDANGHVSAATAVEKSDITALGIPEKDTVYTHPTTPGNKHIPSGGGTADSLIYSADGTAQWGSIRVEMDTAAASGIMSLITIVRDASGKKIKSFESAMMTASESFSGLMSSSDYSKLSALPTNESLSSTYAKKSDITGMYKYKGSVANASNLPTSGQVVGDVYNITNSSEYGGAGMNVVWTGNEWDSLGEIFSIASITNADIDTICV